VGAPEGCKQHHSLAGSQQLLLVAAGQLCRPRKSFTGGPTRPEDYFLSPVMQRRRGWPTQCQPRLSTAKAQNQPGCNFSHESTEDSYKGSWVKF